MSELTTYIETALPSGKQATIVINPISIAVRVNDITTVTHRPTLSISETVLLRDALTRLTEHQGGA